MRFQRFLAIALLSAGCGGGGSVGSAIDAAGIDGPPGSTIDAPPASGPDAGQFDCAPVKGTTIALETVIPESAGLEMPLLVTAPAGDPRLFIIEQGGRIRIVKDGALLPDAFLDIDNLATGNPNGSDERGLLGLAFHPDYASNGRFFVYYTSSNANVVAEYRVSANDPDRADGDSARVLFPGIEDDQGNHNGGMIEFGPDGQLWIGTGDGGGQNDNEGHAEGGNAQNDGSLHGKILRFDVDAEDAEPTIWAKGLRNPWRWSFDRATNDIYIADVGQGEWEEINVVATNRAGYNFGWRRYEAERFSTANPDDSSDRAGLTFPAVAHPHNNQTNPTREGGWLSITGGQVYRGTCFPDLDGVYFYSDYRKEELWKFKWVNGQVTEHARVFTRQQFVGGPTSIHADAFGELYVTDADNQISRIVVRP
jgi:glucose/arabinose dehydrogenase